MEQPWPGGHRRPRLRRLCVRRRHAAEQSAFGSQFFDEQFFLYYEDDDLCTCLFNQRQAMVIDPVATATHHSRGSVRGRSPLRSDYIRGYHHAQSKLIYAHKYQSTAVARHQQRKPRWRWRCPCACWSTTPACSPACEAAGVG